MRTVHVVVPGGIDDPRRPSGGNVYDRRVCTELTASGWTVLEHEVGGPWPDPRPADTAALAAVLDAIADRSVVLLDGLVASAAARLLDRYAARLRLVVLVHLPLGVAVPARRGPERALLSQVAAVVTTSEWTRSWLADEYRLDAARVQVAVPGADPAGLAEGTASGGSLLCVGALTPMKGHDVLADALTRVLDLDWHCACVGSLDVEPAFARALRERIERTGLASRVDLDGPRVGAALDAAYLGADVLVLASRAETYGMVVTEALARGLPVIATRTGGTSEALGRAPDGSVPGILVQPEDADALATAVRAWLEDPALRARLRHAAAERRSNLPTWSDTAARIAEVLAKVLACG